MTLFEIATGGSVIALSIAFLAGAYYGIKLFIWIEDRYKNPPNDENQKRGTKRRGRK